MKNSKNRNLRIFFSLAASICLAMAAMAAFTVISMPPLRAKLICAGMGFGGLALCVIGVLFTSVTALVQEDLRSPITCLAKPRFLGLMLVVASTLIYGYINANLQDKVAPVLSRFVRLDASASLPPLKLSAILFNGNRSSALINGELVRAGQQLDGVLISQICSDSITVEFRGQKKVIGLLN